MWADRGVILTHNTRTPHCFKGNHDAAGKDATAAYRRHIAATGESHSYRSARAWAELLATKKLIKPLNPEGAVNDFAANRNRYVHVSYEPSSFEKLKLASEAVKDVRKYRQSVGGKTPHADSQRQGYVFTRRVAACNCKQGSACKHLPKATQARVHVARQGNDRQLRSHALEEFFQYGKEDAFAAAAGADVDEDFEGKTRWWLLRIARGGAFKAANGFTAEAGNKFKRGSVVVPGQWFSFQRELPDGSREYSAPEGAAQDSLFFVKLTGVKSRRNTTIVSAEDVERLDHENSAL